MVGFGTVRYSGVLYCKVEFDTVLYGGCGVWYGMVRCGLVRYGTVWDGMVWYGIVWYCTVR